MSFTFLLLIPAAVADVSLDRQDIWLILSNSSVCQLLSRLMDLIEDAGRVSRPDMLLREIAACVRHTGLGCETAHAHWRRHGEFFWVGVRLPAVSMTAHKMCTKPVRKCVLAAETYSLTVCLGIWKASVSVRNSRLHPWAAALRDRRGYNPSITADVLHVHTVVLSG